MKLGFQLYHINFNPRSYKRSDLVRTIQKTQLLLFQSTLLQEERQYGTSYTSAELNFNPRSYKRSDMYFISQFVLVFYFNPRSYKRSDVPQFLANIHDYCISIHAPTRGATTPLVLDCELKAFQSTLLQEERQ